MCWVLSPEWPRGYSSSVYYELLNMTVRGYQYHWVSLVLSDRVSLAWLFWTWLNYSSLWFWLKPLFLLTKSLRSVSFCFNPLSRYVYGLPCLTCPFGDKIKLKLSEYKADSNNGCDSLILYLLHSIYSFLYFNYGMTSQSPTLTQWPVER